MSQNNHTIMTYLLRYDCEILIILVALNVLSLSKLFNMLRVNIVTTLSGRAWFGEISSKVDDACVVKHDTDVVV